MTPNPYTKQYLMTAGPTPVPPAVSQAMAAPMLYHRAPAFDELYERVLGKLPSRLPHAEPRAGVRRQRLAARWSRRWRTSSARATRSLVGAAGKFGERWIQLGEAYGAELVRYEPGWGERLDPAEIDRLLGENAGVEVVVRHAQRDLDRHRPRHPGDRRGRPPARRDPRRSTPCPASARPSCGRTTWGVDVVVAGSQKALMCPPGLAFASVSPSARSSYAERAARRPLLLRLGQDRQEPGARARARSRRPCRCSSASTSRSA